MSLYLDAIQNGSSSSTAPPAPTCSCATSAPTTSAGTRSRGATRCCAPPAPTWSPTCTGHFSTSGCDVVETDSFGSLPWVLAEYGIADRTHELAQRSAAIAREVADSYRPGAAGWPAPSDRGPRSPRSARSASPSSATATEEAAAGLLEGGVDLFVIETVQDLLQAKAAIIGVPPGHGRGRPPGARPGAGHHRDDRPDAHGHRDRRRPDQSRRPAPRRHRPQLRHRTRRDERAPALPLPALPGADLGAAQRRSAVGRRRPHALRPDAGRSWPSITPASSPNTA